MRRRLGLGHRYRGRCAAGAARLSIGVFDRRLARRVDPPSRRAEIAGPGHTVRFLVRDDQGSLDGPGGRALVRLAAAGAGGARRRGGGGSRRLVLGNPWGKQLASPHGLVSRRAMARARAGLLFGFERVAHAAPPSFGDEGGAAMSGLLFGSCPASWGERPLPHEGRPESAREQRSQRASRIHVGGERAHSARRALGKAVSRLPADPVRNESRLSDSERNDPRAAPMMADMDPPEGGVERPPTHRRAR